MVDEPNPNRNATDLDDALNRSLNDLDNQIDANLNNRRRDGAPHQPENPSAQGDVNPQIPRDAGSNGENPPAGGGSEPPVDNGNGENNQVQTVFDGMSHAYAGSANPFQNKKTQSKPKTDWPKPGKKPDTKVSAPKGSTLHEMLWNELLTFYEWVIDKSVDLVLDFATFIVYPQCNSSSEKAEENNDVFAIGNLQYENWQKEQLKNKDEVVALHEEIIKNLERQKIGAPLVWEHLGEKPAFFDNLFILYTEVERNP
ncbi:MAG: hypothetical protein NC177_16910, partial [Ruminococcus flavefaciens]|nr:hypothetical protein [Ruminococcus flavefaciens]